MKNITFVILLIIVACQLSAQSNKYKTTHSDTIDVLHYTIDLSIDFPGQEISGSTSLEIKPKIDNLSIISLDLLKLNIDSIIIDDVLNSNYTYNDTLINITPISPISINDTIEVEVYYHGHPVEDPSGWGGFYFTTNYIYNLGVGFEDNPHNYGRVWYPCIDDFVDRATYDCYITAEETKTSVCGGTLQSIVNNGDGTKTTHWNLDDEIPTYLTSIAVGNYVMVPDTFNGQLGDIPIAYYVAPGDSMNAVNSFINIKQVLQGFETYFGPYMWDRVGYVSVPFNSGAMEHVTNIAYPAVCINGNLAYESLAVHELSHHWFGDLVTCREAEDMWINEGWAVFCEFFYEELLYGEDAYKTAVRDNHKDMLRSAHLQDDSYLPVVGIPHEYTYGTTVYHKGADMVHSIRGYLGDSLFFESVKTFLDSFAYNDITSEQLKNVLSSVSGIDMTDFFDGWIYEPGYVHLSIDSFNVTPSGPDYNVTVYMRQKHKGPGNYANSNRVEVTFMDNNWDTHTVTVEFNGITGSQTFSIPLEPQIAMLDYNEKISDAITDDYQIINTTGNVHFDNDNTYFEADIEQITDSAFIRVEHNWVAPDSLQTPIFGLHTHDYRYWKVDGILPSNFHATASFLYSRSTSVGSNVGYLDNTFITTPFVDSLVMLYRPNTSVEWSIENSSRTGNIITGTIVIDTLKLGEYAFGFYDTPVGIHNNNHTPKKLNIYPNPSNKEFNIEFNIENNGKIEIYNVLGKKMYNKNCNSNENKIVWAPENHIAGIYFVKLTEQNEKIEIEKIILE